MQGPDIFMPGDIVTVLDNIDLETKTYATIKAIEPDDEIDSLVWLYLAANRDKLNDKIHPVYGAYWDMIVAGDPRLELVCRDTDIE